MLEATGIRLRPTAHALSGVTFRQPSRSNAKWHHSRAKRSANNRPRRIQHLRNEGAKLDILNPRRRRSRCVALKCYVHISPRAGRGSGNRRGPYNYTPRAPTRHVVTNAWAIKFVFHLVGPLLPSDPTGICARSLACAGSSLTFDGTTCQLSKWCRQSVGDMPSNHRVMSSKLRLTSAYHWLHVQQHRLLSARRRVIVVSPRRTPTACQLHVHSKSKCVGSSPRTLPNPRVFRKSQISPILRCCPACSRHAVDISRHWIDNRLHSLTSILHSLTHQSAGLPLSQVGFRRLC